MQYEVSKCCSYLEEVGEMENVSISEGTEAW